MARRSFFFKHPLNVISCILLCAALLLSACGSPNNFQGGTESVNAVAMKEMSPLPAADDATSLASSAGVLGAYADIPKKIIKEGSVRFSVRDYKQSREGLIAIVSRNGGEIISEQENRSEVNWITHLDIRVPSAKFDSCLDALAGTAENLIEKKITSKDVTEEYVDVSARMKARKDVEQRYLDILKQAKTVEDILKVEEQLKNIREEVEAAQGRLQYIDHNVSTSVIHLSFFQTLSNTTPQGPGFFSRAFFSIKDGWNGLLGLFISLIGLWPAWMVLAVLVVIIRRYRKRRRMLKAVA